MSQTYDIEDKFTIEEIRKYLLSQNSRGDIIYNLSAENIRGANTIDPLDDPDYDEEHDN